METECFCVEAIMLVQYETTSRQYIIMLKINWKKIWCQTNWQ